jgi:PAS domain-containing protein
MIKASAADGASGMSEPAAVPEHGPDRDEPAPFDFAAILEVADAIPVMIAYCDANLRYRFLNRALAEWLEAPRATILGKTMREVLGG